MDKQYTWNWYNDGGIWQHESFDTIEECIADAKRDLDYYDEEKDSFSVFIGECADFTPYVDARHVLENIEEDAIEFAGDAAEMWDAFDAQKDGKILDELSDELTKVVREWLKKHGREPRFCAVENIKQYFVGPNGGYVNT